MIVDDIKITVTAGHGGSGIVAFSKIKGMKGPMGGNGGIGGNIFLEGAGKVGPFETYGHDSASGG